MTDVFWRSSPGLNIDREVLQVLTLTLTDYYPENCGFCAK